MMAEILVYIWIVGLIITIVLGLIFRSNSMWGVFWVGVFWLVIVPCLLVCWLITRKTIFKPSALEIHTALEFQRYQHFYNKAMGDPAVQMAFREAVGLQNQRCTNKKKNRNVRIFRETSNK